MNKPNIRAFLRWALPHAVISPDCRSANLPIPFDEVGTDPAHYLLGTIWVKCTKTAIWAAYDRKYASTYTKEQFEAIVADWSPESYATDCQGLNDAFFRYIWNGGDHTTDTNANGCYNTWCGEKGLIKDRLTLPLGAAVFKADSEGKKTHIGYICGFLPNGEPLVLEAQGLKYGVRVNLLKDRPVFTYYGIMDKKYDYSEEYPALSLPVRYEKPVLEGTGYAKLQEALNWLGYKDGAGNTLVVDGKWGEKSQAAFDWLVVNNSTISVTDICFRVNGLPCEIILDGKEE